MTTVASHATPIPTASTISIHECPVGRGSLACHRWKAKAAAIETAHCAISIREIRIGKA